MLRRTFIKWAGLSLAATALAPSVLSAAEKKKIVGENAMPFTDALNKATGGKTPSDSSKIKLTAPEIAENGAVVPVKVEIDSPMTDKKYVKRIHVFASKNSNARCAAIELTPANGKAYFATRLKLGGTQEVVAVAELSDGTFIQAKQSVKVTIGGCG
jgi:sulfur-oxidizing protein SoxY